MLTPVEMLCIGYVMGAASIVLPLLISARVERRHGRKGGGHDD